MLYFSKDHEYLRLEGDIATVGISDYAQNALGDVVFVELPDVGRVVKQGEECAVVESVKAASDIYAPLSGEIIKVNPLLENAPGTINEDPMMEGWFFQMRVRDKNELAALMSAADYKTFVDSL